MPKQRTAYRIDARPLITVQAGTTDATEDLAPPALPAIPAPTGLSLATSIGYSSAAPSAIISATWNIPAGTEPQRYVVQVSPSNTFPDATTRTETTVQASIAMDGFNPGVTHYVRVAAQYYGVQSNWSSTASILSASDTVPAGVPTSVAAVFVGTGDLLITCVNPTEANFKDVEFKIKASSGGATYRTIYSATGWVLYTVAMNLNDTANVGDPSLYVELRSRTFSNVLGTTVNTGLVTKAIPSTPTVSHTWSGDTGTAGADLTFSWTVVTDARVYRLTLNAGTARETGGTTRVYPLSENIAQNGSADPTITYSLVALDGLGQSSTAATGAATNAAPPTTAISITAGFSALAIAITPSAAADLRDYTARVIKDGVTQTTIRSSSPDLIYKATSRGSYTVGVIVNDRFGQASSETISSAVVLDALTIEELRADTIFTDSVGNSAATLAILKDGSQASSVSYALSASAYRWTQAERPMLERTRQATIIFDANVTWYLATSSDGTTWDWFSGPVAVDGRTLTAVASEAAAQAAAVASATLGNGSGAGRVQLPALTEVRYVRLYHRRTGGSYGLYEFYPRRLVQSDDAEFEFLKAIHIGAGVITADKLFVLTLSAITADMGTLTAGTITGGTVQTATSGARVVLSSASAGGIVGYNGSDTYNVSSGSGTYQVLWQKSTGKLLAGGGVVVLDANGINITGDAFSYDLINLSPVPITRENAIEWTVGSGQKPSISGSSSNGQLLMRGQEITLAIPIGSDDNYGLNLQASGSHLMTATSLAVSEASSTAATAFQVTAGLTAAGCSIKTEGGANIGSASGAGTGEIHASAGLYSERIANVNSSNPVYFPRASTGVVETLRLENTTNTSSNGNAITFRNASTGFNAALIHARRNAAATDYLLEFGAAANFGTAHSGAQIRIYGNGGHLTPLSAGTQNLGDATNYWGDVSYKTLTDRGCLAMVNEWELGDGRRVSATEALLALRAHPTEKTIYGEVKLDYASVPKHSHKPAPVAEDDIYEDDPDDRDADGKPKKKLKHKKGDKLGTDGVEMTSLLSVMIGAMREQAAQIAALQSAVSSLKTKDAR